MNGSEFYESFKDALHALGLDWSDQELMHVSIVNNSIKYQYGSRAYIIDMAGGAQCS